jgi:hypothetical protein
MEMKMFGLRKMMRIYLMLTNHGLNLHRLTNVASKSGYVLSDGDRNLWVAMMRILTHQLSEPQMLTMKQTQKLRIMKKVYFVFYEEMWFK